MKRISPTVELDILVQPTTTTILQDEIFVTEVEQEEETTDSSEDKSSTSKYPLWKPSVFDKSCIV